jgi:GT2 family glycosyltransferase
MLAEPSQTTASISVVIPNYRRPQLVVRCLSSVLGAVAASADEIEVIVVDDGSGDGSCDMVRDRFPEVTLVALDANRGYPTAVNAGIAASQGEWVLTLNNDTTVDAGVFAALLEVAHSRPRIGLVAAQQRFSADRDVIYSAGTIVDARGHASDRLMGEPASVGETEPVEVFGACGAAALYRRSMLAELGGLDERFAFGLEDVDIAWRARMRGWSCVYAPAAIVYHEVGGTIRHSSELRLFQAGRNRWLLIAKNMDRGQLIRGLPGILAFDLAYVAFAWVRLRTLAPVRGRIAGLRLWRAARAAGNADRRPIELSPAQPLLAALARRRQWRQAGGDHGAVTPRPEWSDAT